MPSMLHSNNSLVSEVVRLRKKYASAMREKDKLLIEVARLRHLEMKHREFMNIFEPLSSSLLSQLDGLAVFHSKIKDVVKLGRKCEVPKENKPLDQSGSPMKTMAVSPMINGHLLKKASISLQRVNFGTSNRGRGDGQWHSDEHRTIRRNVEPSSLVTISEHSSSSDSIPSVSQESYQLCLNPVVPLQRLSLTQQNAQSSTSHETRLLLEEINTRIPVVRLQSLSLQNVPSEQENQSVLQSQAMVLLDRLHISSVTDSVNSVENSPVTRPEHTTQIPITEDVHEEVAVVTQEFAEENGAIFSNCCSASVSGADTSHLIEAVPEPQPFVSDHLGDSTEQSSSSENTLTNNVSCSMDGTIMRCESITTQQDSSVGSIIGMQMSMQDTFNQSIESTSESSPSLTRTYLDLDQTIGVLSYGMMNIRPEEYRWSHLAEEQVPSNVVPVVEPLALPENEESTHSAHSSSNAVNQQQFTEENNQLVETIMRCEIMPQQDNSLDSVIGMRMPMEQVPSNVVPVMESLALPENEESTHSAHSPNNDVNEQQFTEENNQYTTPIIQRARRRCTLNVNYKLSPCNKKKRRE